MLSNYHFFKISFRIEINSFGQMVPSCCVFMGFVFIFCSFFCMLLLYHMFFKMFVNLSALFLLFLAIFNNFDTLLTVRSPLIADILSGGKMQCPNLDTSQLKNISNFGLLVMVSASFFCQMVFEFSYMFLTF